MAEALAQAVGIRAELVEGDNGIFDVALDGHVVYSRHETGGFPSDSEIVGLVRARMDGPAV